MSKAEFIRQNTSVMSPPLVPEIKLHLAHEAVPLWQKTEEELGELGLKSRLGELIQKAYDALGLITFYTIKGGQELHAWPIKRGSNAPEAGGAVHTDFQEKFIRAEVIPFAKLVEAGSWHKARELGWLRIEGRGYVVEDGDVIEFRI